MTPYLSALTGGALLGLSAALYLVLAGRIAGISGLLGRALSGRGGAAGIPFLLGLMAGPWAYALLAGGLPAMTVAASPTLIAIAGLLVGVGTRMGSGCTSGHGILGLARLSRRSMAATATFLATGVLVATLTGALS